MKRVQKNLKLSEECISDLVKLSKEQSCSQSEIVEQAIRKIAESYPKDSQQIATEKALETLQNQLEIKDQQIAALNTALVSAQDTVKAAQALHAAEVAPSLSLESQEAKQGRWARLKAAWRG